MKTSITALLSLLAIGQIAEAAETTMAEGANELEMVQAQRKYEIFVTRADCDLVEDTNRGLRRRNDRDFLLDIGTALMGRGTSEVVNISSKLLGLGVEYLTDAIKGDREKWYNEARKQCRFHRVLKTDQRIDDFYAVGSEKGAMDPENMKFNGFGCRNYLVTDDDKGEDVFYLYCSLKRDDEGLDHIRNHSKFLVQVDELFFVPRTCNLPNDSTGQLQLPFDFATRKDLTFNVRARIYSSWFNEAIIMQKDQLLGEFDIVADIRPEALRDGVFHYTPGDSLTRGLVQVTGESFIVPRSFTGTTDARTYKPSWGTGQYRIEMEVTESCKINDAYYQKERKSQDKPGKWDGAKWKPEWKKMKATHKATPKFLDRTLEVIKKDYDNFGWVAVITDPLTTTIIATETKSLKDLTSFAGQGANATGSKPPVKPTK